MGKVAVDVSAHIDAVFGMVREVDAVQIELDALSLVDDDVLSAELRKRVLFRGFPLKFWDSRVVRTQQPD